jgi:heptosyltransferase-2
MVKPTESGTHVGAASLAGLTRLIGGRRVRGGGAGFDPSAIRRILVVRLDEIGDAAMTVPTLRALRHHFDSAHITLVVRPAAGQLLAHCPHVDELLVLSGPLHGVSRIFSRYKRALSFVRRELGDRSYDLALIPRWEVDKYFATTVAYLSRADRIVAYSEAVSKEKAIKNRGFDRLLTHPVNGGHGLHEVERSLGLAKFVGAPAADASLELWTDADDETAAEQLLGEAGLLPGTAVVAIAPGAALGRRQWPADRFAEVATALSQRHGLHSVVVGGPEDAALGAQIAELAGGSAIDLTGRPSLRQVVAILRRCRLFIGNDSGPMHLAAAVGTPVVEVSCHPTGGDPEHHNAPERFGPWGTISEIVRPAAPRSPCVDGCQSVEAHCILDVSVEQVTGAADRLLDRERSETSTGRLGEVAS